MLFPTVTFAVFFMIVLPVSWALMPHQRAWRIWILLASYVFYAWWDWHFIFLLFASTIVNHVLGGGSVTLLTILTGLGEFVQMLNRVVRGHDSLSARSG